MLTVCTVVCPNCEQACVLSLGARIRLQADRVVPSNLTQVLGQALNHLLIAFRLVRRSKRVNQCKLRPSDRDHFHGCIELHRAGTQRDHGAIQRQVLIGQFTQVAQHVRLRLNAREHGVAKDRALALQVCWHAGQTNN